MLVHIVEVPMLALLPLVITSGLLALVLYWPRVHSGPSGVRLVADMVVSTLVLFALLSGLLVAAQRLPG
jgi:RsiW-degrading membrane proteinase PrsW (M82 family)